MPPLSTRAVDEIGRLLNGAGHPRESAIAHLVVAAARGAQSLAYLADIDDQRFSGVWPRDGHENDAVDDGHVRWAATGALTSLDQCAAAASRLGHFAKHSSGEDSIRDFYHVTRGGRVEDTRELVPPPWRAWFDSVIEDARYRNLLRVRNALVHADARRHIKGFTGAIAGHSMRFGFSIRPMDSGASGERLDVDSRDIVVSARDISIERVEGFIELLAGIQRES